MTDDRGWDIDRDTIEDVLDYAYNESEEYALQRDWHGGGYWRWQKAEK